MAANSSKSRNQSKGETKSRPKAGTPSNGKKSNGKKSKKKSNSKASKGKKTSSSKQLLPRLVSALSFQFIFVKQSIIIDC